MMRIRMRRIRRGIKKLDKMDSDEFQKNIYQIFIKFGRNAHKHNITKQKCS